MFTLRLFVMGLAALVPDGNNLTIVLQSTSGHTKHYPVLIYPQSDNCPPSAAGDGGSCSPHQARSIALDLGLKQNLHQDEVSHRSWLRSVRQLDRGLESRDFGGILLDGRQLAIGGARAGSLEFVRGPRKNRPLDAAGAVPLTAAELTDFSWVPAMAEISPRAARIKHELIHDPSALQVAGILTLQGVAGKVTTFKVADTGSCKTHLDRQPTIYSMDFRTPREAPQQSTPRQALGEVLLIEIPIEDDEATITFSPLRDAGPGASEAISIRPAHGGSAVDVLLANLVPLPEQLECSFAPDPHHVGLYFEMSQGSPPPDLPSAFLGENKILAHGINPELPDILAVVSLPNVLGGIYTRPICTLLAFNP